MSITVTVEPTVGLVVDTNVFTVTVGGDVTVEGGAGASTFAALTDVTFGTPSDRNMWEYDTATSKLVAIPRNAADGWVGLDGSALIPENLIPASIARDTEVAELARDAIGTALVAGDNITVTVDDGLDTITIAATVPEGSDGLHASLTDTDTDGHPADVVTTDAWTTALGTSVEAANVQLYLQQLHNNIETTSEEQIPDAIAESQLTMSSTFVFNSGGAQTGNRFNDWGDLIDALANVPDGSIPWIYFEADATITATGMPGGGWDLNGARLRGNGVWGGSETGGRQVTISDGVKLLNPATEFVNDGLLLYSTSTDSVIDVPTIRSFYFTNDALIVCSTHPFFEVTAAGTATGAALFSFRLGSGFLLPSTLGMAGDESPVLDIATGAQANVSDSIGVSHFDNNSVSGAGLLVRVIRAPSADLTGDTHADLSGSFFKLSFADLANMKYTRGVEADWDSTPASGAAAIDELAARTRDAETEKVTGDGVTDIVALTQAAYDLLTPDASTLYVITDA